MVLEKTFESPWTARRSNWSILKEISPGCSLEGMMLKLKLQYFGHLMRRVDSLEKTDAGRDWGQGHLPLGDQTADCSKIKGLFIKSAWCYK